MLDKNCTDRYNIPMSSENRDRILDCALRLFAARGYAAVGVQEIVDEAAITKPTLYHYFGSKLGLLEALLQTHLAQRDALLNPVLAYRGDLIHSLNQITLALFRFARANPTFYRLYLALWFAPPASEAFQTASPYHLRLHSDFETLFAQAANDHGNMRGRQQAYAASFLGLVHTYIGLALNGYGELDDALAYQVVHQFMHGIFS